MFLLSLQRFKKQDGMESVKKDTMESVKKDRMESVKRTGWRA
jgi:hypothetical protein